MIRKRPLPRRLSPLRLLFREFGDSASLSRSQNGEGGWREGILTPLHRLFLDRKCVMEWEEPHDSTLYCLQTDGNHLLATGSSYYGVVRLWDRRQRACLHVSIRLPHARLPEAGTHVYGLHLGVGVPGAVEEAHNAPGPSHWAWESWVWALPPPTWATLVILVPYFAGLPADVDAPEQSGVLPALHHQASLCGAVLQPSRPGLSKPMTGRPS